jgi:hypothetical protein
MDAAALYFLHTPQYDIRREITHIANRGHDGIRPPGRGWGQIGEKFEEIVIQPSILEPRIRINAKM